MARTKRDRDYDRYRHLYGQVRGIYRQARGAHPHTWILAELKALWASEEYRRLPQFYRRQLTHTSHVLLDETHERDLDWRLGPAAGPISTRDGRTDWTPELSALSNQPGALYGSHYWRGTEVLFGEWQRIN